MVLRFKRPHTEKPGTVEVTIQPSSVRNENGVDIGKTLDVPFSTTLPVLLDRLRTALLEHPEATGSVMVNAFDVYGGVKVHMQSGNAILRTQPLVAPSALPMKVKDNGFSVWPIETFLGFFRAPELKGWRIAPPEIVSPEKAEWHTLSMALFEAMARLDNAGLRAVVQCATARALARTQG